MGCSASTLTPAQQNNNVPNGNVKPAEPAPNRSPKNERKPSKERRDSSSSSSSSSSDGSVASKDKNKKDHIKEEVPVATQSTQPESENVKENENVNEIETVQENENVNENVKESEAPEEEPVKEEEVKETEKEVEVQEKDTTDGNTNETQDEPAAQEKPNFTEEVLKSFVELETEIKDLENKSQDSILQAEYQRLLELHKGLQTHMEKVEELKRQTIKEYQDIVQVTHPSVRAMFVNETQHNAQVAKEQQEYLDALNRQEVAEQELNSMKEQYKNLYNDYNSHSETIRSDRKKLQDLKYKQEGLLGKVFNDNYGSDKEWKLEMELDLLGEKKERIKSAHYKWSNARSVTASASSQINWASKRWKQILTHNVQAQMAKYQMTAETRNHLVAAVQNIRSTHKYLSPIKVPYFSENDIAQLEGSINTIFHDVQIPTTYRQAYANFTEHYNKSLNLLNWIDQVLKSTINPDYDEVKRSYHTKYYELKEERTTLIQNIIKEKLGVEMTLEIKKEEYKETEEAVVSDQQVVKPGEVTKEEGEEQAPEPEAQNEEPPAEIPETAPESGEGEGANPDAAATEEQPSESKPRIKAVPLSELAPAPNQEDLFGNIDQLKKKHEEEIAEFEKAQEMNKARVEQGLHERLQARRNRRRKMQQQQAETAELTGENDNSLPLPIE